MPHHIHRKHSPSMLNAGSANNARRHAMCIIGRSTWRASLRGAGAPAHPPPRDGPSRGRRRAFVPTGEEDSHGLLPAIQSSEPLMMKRGKTASRGAKLYSLTFSRRATATLGRKDLGLRIDFEEVGPGRRRSSASGLLAEGQPGDYSFSRDFHANRICPWAMILFA
jgi:hypothetical protein